MATRKKYQSPLTLGNKVFIRCITHYYTGKIVLLTATEVVLADAAWIADTGRFAQSLETGEFSEIEPYIDPVTVGRGSICDATLWRHALPRKTK